jgi:hypothetical protein
MLVMHIIIFFKTQRRYIMRTKILTHYIRVRVSDADHLFLENLLKHSDITISELLREFVLKLRSKKSAPGKHQG